MRTPLRVLVAFKEGDTDNLFVETLCRGIAGLGVDITYSTERFWNEEQASYDIIHLQWPEELVGWVVQCTRSSRAATRTYRVLAQ